MKRSIPAPINKRWPPVPVKSFFPIYPPTNRINFVKPVPKFPVKRQLLTAQINGNVESEFQKIRYKKEAEEEVVRRMSQLKALEHMAIHERDNNFHRTQNARQAFEEAMNNMMSLVIETKLAQMNSQKALAKYSSLEKTLTNDDLELSKYKHIEDILYEELINKEKDLVNANLEIIPQINSEEDLEKFINNAHF